MVIRLGVNIDHCATLRQVRGGITSYPNVIECATWAQKGGADLITIHLREDRRHIQDRDLKDLCRWRKLPINLELAPDPAMLEIALKSRPDWICFVPEKRQELTTEGGLDLERKGRFFRTSVPQIKQKKIKISAFIEPSIKMVEMASDLGFDAVEFHTGHWVRSRGKSEKKIWSELVEAAQKAHALGLQVHAGHGLDDHWTQKILNLPFLEEVNIGHYLICEALRAGLEQAVRKIKSLLLRKSE